MKNAIATSSLVMRFTAEEKGRIRDGAKISGWNNSASWGRKILMEIAEAVLQGEPKVPRAARRCSVQVPS